MPLGFVQIVIEEVAAAKNRMVARLWQVELWG